MRVGSSHRLEGARARRRWRSTAVVTVTLGGLLALGSASTPLAQAATPPPKPGSASAGPTSALVTSAGPTARLATTSPGGPVTFVGTGPGQAITVSGGGTAPESVARAFVDQYGAAFGEPSPAQDLRQFDTSEMGNGGESVGYRQHVDGVPVFAGELRVQVAPGGKVRSAAGEMSVAGVDDTTPKVLAEVAAETARAAVADDAGVDAATLTVTDPELWVYDPTLIGNQGAPRLVWRTDVSSTVAAVNRMVFVDAHSGEVVLLVEQVESAKNRQVCDDQNVLGRSYTCPNAAAPVVRAEGQAATGNSEVDKAYDLSGATYDYYSAKFARNSIDNAGLALRSTVRHCPTGESCPYANAFWDGSQMVYGDTFAGADDVVGHELTHGVTQYESNLVYANQSGAINESLSDVFGEFVDLTTDTVYDNDTAANRWLMGEDLPIGAIRDMENPPAFGDPDRMGSPNFYTGSADSGGVHTNSGVNNKAAFLITDGATFNGQTITGLGIVKAGRIYYEAQTNILTSGSDYTALGNALNQACLNVTGVDGITATDCTQVAKAVTATEMIVPPPANDNFASAQVITGTSGTTTGSTLGATRQTGEPCHGGSGCGSLTGTASIWYKFTAAGSGTATITTCNSNFDTLLGVYTGAAVNSLTAIIRNDDASPSCSNSSLNSSVQFAATQGTTYSIAVDGYSAAKGSVTLNWTLPAAPAPTGVSGTVTETGGVTPVGGAFVAVLNSADFSIAGGGVADGSGNYNAQVPAGTYYLYVIDPAATHPAGFFGAPTLVTVTNGQMVDKDPTMASSLGTIAGTVTEDGTGTPIAGAWAIPMSASTSASEVAAVANGSGQFSRSGLRVGNHFMVYVDPTGAHSPEFFANSPTPTGANQVTVTGGGTATANDSMAVRTPPATGSTLTGTVTESGTNTPLANVMVVALKATDFGFGVAAMTNASGQYSLNVPAGGTFKLEFIDSTGLHDGEWFNNQPIGNIGSAATVTAPSVNNASLDRRNGSMTGTVTDDVSNAAVQGAWVMAIGPAGIAGGAVTAANGTYTISGLPAGSYVATFVDPAGGRTQEYFNNSSTYAGATPLAVAGGGSATANAALHHP